MKIFSVFMSREFANSEEEEEAVSVIVEVLENKDDEVLVHQWAANATFRFTKSPPMLSVIQKGILDPSENLAIRHSLLGALDCGEMDSGRRTCSGRWVAKASSKRG